MTDEQTATTPAFSAPRMIANRYRVGAELGRGGMGVVWRAEDTVIGRQVAIKELRLPDGAEDAGVFQERVLREVRTGGRLNDPAVVTVFDVVAEHDTTYIVMELVEAPTLSDLVRRNGPLPPQQVASIGLQVLSALRAAHQAGIVHRDVKPANIMVGADGRVKLTDFGIAQAIDDPRITTSGMLVGSPAFMAPERVEGREAMPASDLWSLGASLFFAAEGSVPFERASTAATLHAIMTEVPYLTRVHGPLASAIMGLMTATPEGRITTEQAHGLLSLAAQQPGSIPSPPGQPTSHQPGSAPTMVAGHPTYGGVPAPQRMSPGKKKALITGGALAAVGLLVGGFFLGKPVWSPDVDEQMLPTLTYGENGDIEQLNADGYNGCVNTTLDKGRSLAESNWVGCDQSHDLELYTTWNLGYSNDEDAVAYRYPGQEAFAHFGETVCGFSFHSSKVKDEFRDQLVYRALIPTKEEWEKQQDDPARSVYCLLGREDGTQMSESVVQQIR
ncbi:serine/threonine-protein kinase [Saccharomonospora viridis]|uniref:non-specific serine/threonine protein kinase n=1 Tax=Saccharomonospora viridis TaxID=1852 RepID=A0A837DAM1_9PSEU|nr:serine/threonine-protein kinase [Saccharomonospora viridis]KHF43641.1 serine/threonine protein kinase [Saccharomonospora viridis]SFP86901.1 Serine/threonine protein kinase [Saccharomonospora viridis]